MLHFSPCGAYNINIVKPYHIVSICSICYPIYKMKIIITLIYLSIFLPSMSFGMYEVVLQEVSTSGKSLKLNIGSLHGVNIDDNGEISIFSGTTEVPKYTNIASGRVIKVFPNFSYWFFPEATSRDFIKNKTYSVMLQSKTMLGRTGQKINYRIKSFESSAAKSNLSQSPVANLPKQNIINLQVSEQNVYDNTLKDDDLLVEKEVDVVTKKNFLIDDDFEELKYLRADQAQVDDKKITKENMKRVSSSQNKAQLNNITKSKHGLEELYYKDSKVKYISSKEERKLEENMSRKYYEELTQKEMLPDSTIAMIKKEGPMWSGDMDKDELQNYLITTGIAAETVRRENAMLFKSGNEVTIYFGSNISNHATPLDQSHQNNGFSIGIAYELYLARASQKLQSWSIDMIFEQGTLNVDLGGVNGRCTYGALGVHANYYFLNYPHSRNKLSMYVGGGIKRGNSDVTSANFSKDYEYEMIALPSLHFGAKYRIPSAKDYEMYSSLGFGFNFKISVDSINFTAISSLDDNILGKTSFNNIKADFGLSFFF